jgi:hypothetical protein
VIVFPLGGQGSEGDEGEGDRVADGGDEGADAGADRRAGDELAGVLDADGLTRPGRAAAASATEVKDRPLSATLTVEAAMSTTAEATAQYRPPQQARASMMMTPETTTQRSTRVRLPTRSLAEPTAMRPRHRRTGLWR